MGVSIKAKWMLCMALFEKLSAVMMQGVYYELSFVCDEYYLGEEVLFPRAIT